MQRFIWVCAVGLLTSFSAGCKATPEKVCKHIRTFDAEIGEPCVTEMRAVEAEFPQYWNDIGACFLATRAPDELVTCYEVMDTIQLQQFCRTMMDRVPDAYTGSISKCLREQRVLLRRDKETWARRAACLEEANTAEAVRACRVQVPKPAASPEAL